MAVCKYCERGAKQIKRAESERKGSKPVGPQGYGGHETSSLIVMLIACIVDVAHDDLDVDRAKKLEGLRDEIDLRLPPGARRVWTDLLKKCS